jgi:hypothetical protein
VSLGAAGAQIFVDGAAYPAATIAANTNGWNNAAVKYLAVFPGPKANAVGLFDHVRLWNVQLSAAQIAALEPARSVTLVVPAPISTWTLNGTGGFADSGAADVDFTIAGTFADLTTGSMVQGGSGNSAYTDGSGTYATLPANVAGHSLSALTLSFYYQRNSTAAKHVLFAVGDGTVAGDLSIEVLPGGLLRGYHVGVDGVLDFFESTNGVTGTSFPIGTARRIELTLGAAGVALYVDGVAYAAAAITGNTNTWNNAAVKYLGCFPGNPVQAMAIGAFDHIRLWNVQLTPAQISMLEAPVSITLPAPPGSTGLPLTPAMDWLPGIDQVPATNVVYVYDSNLGSGNGSSAANAKEIQAALNASSAGQTLVAIAATAGGTTSYNRTGGINFPNNGANGNPIKLMARPGDTVIIDRGNEFARFRTPTTGNNNNWELYDANLHIWRSVATSFGASVRPLGGVWFEGGWPIYILPCDSMAHLQAPLGTANISTNYGGPAACVNTDGRVYVRWQIPDPNKMSFHNKWPTDGRMDYMPGYIGKSGGSTGQIHYPATEDPRDYSIYLVSAPGGSQGGVAFTLNSRSWITLGSGINSFGHKTGVKMSGGNNITFGRATHINTRFHWNFSGTACSNITISRMRCSHGHIKHQPLVNWKFAAGPGRVRALRAIPR